MNFLLIQQAKMAQRGQGVVEYAGALVVATVIISAAIAFAPASVTNIFDTIMTEVSNFLTGEAATL